MLFMAAEVILVLVAKRLKVNFPPLLMQQLVFWAAISSSQQIMHRRRSVLHEYARARSSHLILQVKKPAPQDLHIKSDDAFSSVSSPGVPWAYMGMGISSPWSICVRLQKQQNCLDPSCTEWGKDKWFPQGRRCNSGCHIALRCFSQWPHILKTLHVLAILKGFFYAHT